MALETVETDEMSDAFMQDDVKETETETETTEETPDSVDEENAENPTALLPKSALGKGVKEGDKITLTVTKLHGDEVMVSISSSEKKSKEPMSANDELDAMEKGY